MKLSSELQINVNELLAGEKFLSEEFPSEEYVEKSENNIVNLISELNENGVYEVKLWMSIIIAMIEY